MAKTPNRDDESHPPVVTSNVADPNHVVTVGEEQMARSNANEAERIAAAQGKEPERETAHGRR